MKKFIFAIIIVCLFFVQPHNVQAETKNLAVYVDGMLLEFPDQRPELTDGGRVMVPLRFVSEALMASVEWDESKQIIYIEKNEQKIQLKIGENKAVLDCNTVILDTAVYLKNGRSMIPIRFVSECLRADVFWNERENAVYISKEMPKGSIFSGMFFELKDYLRQEEYVLAARYQEGAQLMTVTKDEFPIKIDDYTIYSIDVSEKCISVLQRTESNNFIPIGFFMIENGLLTRSRNYQTSQKGRQFTFDYPVQSIMDENETNLAKISSFALFTLKDENFKMIVVPNPQYIGGGI